MVQANKIVKYAVLPGFLPRLHALFTSGFVHIAYFIAVIFRSVRLLPHAHPYLNPQNLGKYGIRHVIAEAANNLVISKKNADQVFIFFMICLGMVILLTQFILLVASIVAYQPAFAQANIFTIDGTTIRPDQDIAFIIMDRVFGLQGVFDSCISTAVDCLDSEGNTLPPRIGVYPEPFHIALHTMLRFYSMGIFIISVLVILYLMAAIAAETAESGTAFGKRFNKTWAPVRIILFFALVIPLNIGSENAGLNAAQLIVFQVAKAGSNFATNAWVRFNNDLSREYIGQTSDLVAMPKIPEMQELMRFMLVAKTCKIAEEMSYDYTTGQGIQAYVVRPTPIAYRLITSPDNPDSTNDADIVDHWLASDATYEEALDFNNKGHVIIRFGEYDEEKHKQYNGFVKPTCGQVRLATSGAEGSPLSGVIAVQAAYYDMIKVMWDDPLFAQHAECIVRTTIQDGHNPNCDKNPDAEFFNNLSATYHDILKTQLPALIDQQAQNSAWAVQDTLLDRGWAGASIWYNRIAQLNGNVTTAVLNIPTPNEYPYLMQLIAQKRQMSNESNNPERIFDPLLPDGEKIDYPRHRDQQIAIAMFKAFRFWDDAELDSQHIKKANNIFIDTVNLIFGTYGLFDMFENTDKHPLAQLSTLGKGMMEATARNIGMGLAGMGLGKLLGPEFEGQAANTAGTFLYTMGFVTIAIGFILFYILPFLPFIYFMFAVSGWVKSIFEAIVAMPLWAMAHLQIDGEGSIGQFATNGYFLIFEILLRPILIVVGLIASVSIFAATVEVLNDIFTIVINNVSGFDFEAAQNGGTDLDSDYLRAPVDQFFYTAMYAVVVYLLGISSFKLIDLIPQSILRWMNNTTATFQENAGDPAGTLLQKSYQGTLLITNQVGGGRLAAVLGAGK